MIEIVCSQVNVTNRTNNVDLENYVPNGEWELLDTKLIRATTYFPCCFASQQLVGEDDSTKDIDKDCDRVKDVSSGKTKDELGKQADELCFADQP